MAEQQPVRKAVVAAAGYGTRFLPQTKATPKEMLPIVDKPIIQHVVEELVGAGIEDIVIVTDNHKKSINEHFSAPSKELVRMLEQSGRYDLLNEVEKISSLANFSFVSQKGPYGCAAPIISAEHYIEKEPFIYTFADDFVEAKPSRFAQLIAARRKYGGTILTCVRAEQEEDYKRYGYVGGRFIVGSLVRVDRIVEKPGSAELAPSDLATVSGYLLDPSILNYLHEEQERLKDGQEFTIQVPMQRMIDNGHDIYGCEIANGKYYDTGNKLDYLKAVVDFGLMSDELKDDFKKYLRELNP